MATKKKSATKTEPKTRKPPVRKPLSPEITIVPQLFEANGLQFTRNVFRIDYDGDVYMKVSKTEAERFLYRLKNPVTRTPKKRFVTKCTKFLQAMEMFSTHAELAIAYQGVVAGITAALANVQVETEESQETPSF